MAKSCIFSEEMVTQIVSRLPPKSLMRFKCVCKLWYNVINSPTFVTMNMSNFMHNKFSSFTSIVFKRTILENKNIGEEEIHDHIGDSSVVFLPVLNVEKVLLSLLHLRNNADSDGEHLHSVVEDFSVPPPMALVILQIVGHCDGIICLSTHELAALYNPSIKEFNFLPKSCLLPPPNVAYGYNVGFGYDSKAKDYKVVRIACSISHSDHPPNRGEVYTLSSNSWREIKTNFNTLLYSTLSSGLYFKGVYYWYAFKQVLEHHKEFIVSFDMSEELFHHISLPDHLSITKGCRNHLVALKESIALLSHNRCEVAKTFEVWEMEGFGAAGICE